MMGHAHCSNLYFRHGSWIRRLGKGIMRPVSRPHSFVGFIHISSIQNYGNLFSWISFRHFQQFLKIMCSFVSIPPPTPSKKHRPHLAVGWNVHFHPWKRDEMEL